MNRCWKKRKSSYRSPGGRVRLCSRWTMAEGVFSSVCFFFFCSLFFRFHKSNNTPKRKRWHGAEVRVKGEDVAPLKKALVVVWLVSFLLFFLRAMSFRWASVAVGTTRERRRRHERRGWRRGVDWDGPRPLAGVLNGERRPRGRLSSLCRVNNRKATTRAAVPCRAVPCRARLACQRCNLVLTWDLCFWTTRDPVGPIWNGHQSFTTVSAVNYATATAVNEASSVFRSTWLITCSLLATAHR